MSKLRKQRRVRRQRIHTTEVGRNPKRRDKWSMASGESRRSRREGRKPKPSFPGKNSLGRKRRPQEQRPKVDVVPIEMENPSPEVSPYRAGYALTD